MEKKIIFYRTANDQCPVEYFLDCLPPKAAQKVVWVLQLTVQLNRVPTRYFCKLQGQEDLWECRIKLGSNIYRIFAFWDANKIILTHGFVKKSQKTPYLEIERAKSYQKDYWLTKRVDNT